MDAEALQIEFADDLERIKRSNLIYLTINTVDYAYQRLRQIEVDFSMEFFLENDLLTTGLVVAYGRLFASTEGVTMMQRDRVPADLRHIHDEIIDYRNRRYAHHGGHETIGSNVSVIVDGDTATLDVSINFGAWIGAAPHWEPLIIWLRGYAFTHMKKQVSRLTAKSGITWQTKEGPEPPWVSDPLH